LLLGLEIDQIAILCELTDKGIDMTQSQLGAALQITAHEAVLTHAQLEGGGASILDSAHPILLG
jgi:hypothetical protein